MLNSKCVKIGLNAGFFPEWRLKKCVKYAGFLASLDFTSAIFTYRTRAIIGRSRFEAALVSHWSKSLLVSPDSVPRFSHHFLALIVGIFPEQKMDITLGHDCQFVNCKNKICLCLIRF